LRARIAARDADEEVQQLARARLGVSAALRRSNPALQLSRVRRAIAREQAQLGLEVEGAARARYAVGQGSQTDVLRALIEATRVRQIEIEQAAEETVREAELNRLLGRLPEASVNTAPLAMFPLREPFEVVLERLRALSPERAAAHAAVERARLSVSLAGKDFRPDFTVGAGYMNRGGLDPMWQAAVGIRLPLSRARRHSALREAEARQRAAEARAAAVDRQLQFRTQERLARLAAVERMTALYEGGVVAQDRIAVEAALAGYRSGRTAFLSVLAALGTLYGDRATVARLHAAHGALCATLEEASLDGIVDVPGLPAAMDGAAMGPPAMDVPATPARARGSTVAADPNMDR
jgi:outer membrane protein TolC